jgi:hypothetical protein
VVASLERTPRNAPEDFQEDTKGRIRRAAVRAAGAATLAGALAAACGSSGPTSPTDGAFRVTSVNTSVDSLSFTGSCPHKFTFTATITVNAPGTTTFRWERSDGTFEATQSLTFSAAGSGTQTNTWDVGASSGGWMRIRILGPNETTSNQATFTLSCTTASFAVTSASLSVDAATFSGTCPHRFSFTGSITANGSGTVTYRWERSDGTTGQTETITFTAAGTRTVTDQWNLSASTTAWEQLRILPPNDLVSNQTSVTLTCS